MPSSSSIMGDEMSTPCLLLTSVLLARGGVPTWIPYTGSCTPIWQKPHCIGSDIAQDHVICNLPIVPLPEKMQC